MELSTTTLAIFAVFTVMGLVAEVAVLILYLPEDAEAKGCRTSTAANPSKKKCIQT